MQYTEILHSYDEKCKLPCPLQTKQNKLYDFDRNREDFFLEQY